MSNNIQAKDPWEKYAGLFEGDPVFDEVVEHIKKRRQGERCDHTNCIPRSSLPELPEGLRHHSRYTVFLSDTSFAFAWAVVKDGYMAVAYCANQQHADFLAALLNAAYPAPATNRANSDLIKMAKRNPPPDKWYEDDGMSSHPAEGGK